MAIIGLDIGGTKILGALFNSKGIIIDKEKVPAKGNEGLEVFLKQVYLVIDSLIERSQKEVKGIGVGVPGIVNKKGKVVLTPNLPIKDYPLKKELKNKYNIPVAIGNDVNLGTFGEYSELGIKHDNVIGLFPGTGLGGGIIIDSKLYIGEGFAGELGHITVNKDGAQCGCGNNGCLETYASKKGILSYLSQEISKGRKTLLESSVKKGVLKSSKLKKAVEQKDELALEAMKQFYEYLGMGCGIIMNIFNPDVIIIGGGIIETFEDEMLEQVKKYAHKYTMPGIFDKTKIEKSHLADDAVIYGGYHLIKNKL